MSDARVYYNKLVRDNIPSKIASKGELYEVRVIDDAQELQQELFKKVLEEASALSVSRSKQEFLEEYSDLVLVLETLISKLGISDAEVAQSREENMLKKGGYDSSYFLHWSADSGYKSNETPQGISTKSLQ